MVMLVLASGPHESEQHLLSQQVPVHTYPAGAHGAVPKTVHRPIEAPTAFSQLPPQHSKSFEQLSPAWLQNDTFVQCLLESH